MGTAALEPPAPPPPASALASRRRRRLSSPSAEKVKGMVQAQLDYCQHRGVGVRRLDPREGGGRVVVQLKVPYAGSSFDVIAILYHQPQPQTAAEQEREEEEEEGGAQELVVPYPDLIPLWDAGGGGGEGSRGGEEGATVNEVCGLSRLLPVLRRWSLCRAASLWEVVGELRGAYTQYQVAKVTHMTTTTAEGAGGAMERFNLELLSQIKGVEVMASLGMAGHEARVRLPLWGGEGTTTTEEGGHQQDVDDQAAIPRPPPMATTSSSGSLEGEGVVMVDLVFRWLEGAGAGMGGEEASEPPEVKLTVPSCLPLTKRLASCPPSWSCCGGDVTVYLDRCRAHLAEPWTKRRALLRALGATYGLLEYDALDFSHVMLLTRVKQPPSTANNSRQQPPRGGGVGVYSFLLHLQLGPDYPLEPPTMTVSDFSRGVHNVVLDKSRYRYSPRWDAKRMAQELYDHAITCIRHDQALLG